MFEVNNKKMKVINIFMIIVQINFVEPRTDLVRSKITVLGVMPSKLVKSVNENELPQKTKKYKLSKNSKDRKNRRRIKNDTRNRKRSENRRRRYSKRRYRNRQFARGDF